MSIRTLRIKLNMWVRRRNWTQNKWYIMYKDIIYWCIMYKDIIYSNFCIEVQLSLEKNETKIWMCIKHFLHPLQVLWKGVFSE